jgi:hypothetical protein
VTPRKAQDEDSHCGTTGGTNGPWRREPVETALNVSTERYTLDLRAPGSSVGGGSEA